MVTIRDWRAEGNGRYRVYGQSPNGGFWAIVRLGEQVVIESTNFAGDMAWLVDAVEVAVID